MTHNPVEVPADELRRRCDPAQFDFVSTAELDPLEEVLGQERAVRAIDFGLHMKSPGYNLFVTGIEGTGKSTIVPAIVRRHSRIEPRPGDWAMVNNFGDEFRPLPLPTPAGRAAVLSRDMNKLVDDLQRELPAAFSSDSFQERRNGLRQQYGDRQQKVFQQLEAAAAEREVGVTRTQAGFQTIPLVEGQPATEETFGSLSEEQRAVINDNLRTVKGEIEAAVRQANRMGQELREKTEALQAEVADFVVRGRMELLKSKYLESPEILQYLRGVQEDIVENVDNFLPAAESPPQTPAMFFPTPGPDLDRYRVNLLVDNRKTRGAPVIFEPNPTFGNVFGQIEKRVQMGTLTTDFTRVQAGSLLRANGGYLILEIEPLLMNAPVWEALKRSLQNKLLHIEDGPGGGGPGGGSLRPEPIELNVKVILIGSYEPFQALQNFDSKFNKLFKVRADFDYETAYEPQAVQHYARFIARICRDQEMLHFSPDGVAAVVEFGQRFASHRRRLTLRFGPVTGIIREAHYWARQEGADLVAAAHVERAVRERRFRYNLYEEKVHSTYVDETVMIDVDGGVVGQVNALAVYQVGDLSFGRPARITAESYLGKPGVINIEREANLSGNTHDKGVMILSGYLGRTFAQHHPLGLTISVTFEQSYGGIDGDSASSTELYAILSSLAGAPVRQGIAVTGSVNQKGRVQSIGGVNQKIEGFFDVCRSKGLTGRQGVIIPAANVDNLMLRRPVVEAVRAGRFHIYPVTDIREGIEILTGMAAGQPDPTGNYPDETVFGRTQRKLETFRRRMAAAKAQTGTDDRPASC